MAQACYDPGAAASMLRKLSAKEEQVREHEGRVSSESGSEDAGDGWLYPGVALVLAAASNHCPSLPFPPSSTLLPHLPLLQLSRGMHVPEFMRTHPLTETRVQSVLKQLPEAARIYEMGECQAKKQRLRNYQVSLLAGHCSGTGHCSWIHDPTPSLSHARGPCP
jgi:hypothetical protein